MLPVAGPDSSLATTLIVGERIAQLRSEREALEQGLARVGAERQEEELILGDESGPGTT